MRYFVRKRARFTGIWDQVNLPYGTIVTRAGDLLYQNGKALCTLDSSNGRKYFVLAEDGAGEKRAELVNRIEQKIEGEEPLAASAYLTKRMLEDRICCKVRDEAFPHKWVWKREFYDAAIPDLEHIASLLG